MWKNESFGFKRIKLATCGGRNYFQGAEYHSYYLMTSIASESFCTNINIFESAGIKHMIPLNRVKLSFYNREYFVIY